MSKYGALPNKSNTAPKSYVWEISTFKTRFVIQNYFTGYTAFEAWYLTNCITKLPFHQVGLRRLNWDKNHG